jgi:hypothetical protein
MKYVVAALLGVALLAFPSGTVGAQCEGGTTVAGYYLPDGSYVPGHCATTNPFTPGQLHPSGAQPVPVTYPATGLHTNIAPGLPATPGIAQGASPSSGDPTGAYGTSLSVAAPPAEDGEAPPAPGRGGATIIGEELTVEGGATPD